jgi:hypothetical protein
MAPFIDAFLIGDGEEAIKEILDIFHRWKTEGDGKKIAPCHAVKLKAYMPPQEGEDKRRFIPSSITLRI